MAGLGREKSLYQLNKEFPSQTERDRHDALLPVLDALIGLGAAVPAGAARELHPEFPAQSLIFLVRSPQPDDSARQSQLALPCCRKRVGQEPDAPLLASPLDL